MPEHMSIPTSVTTFQHTLQTGTSDRSNLSDRVQRLCSLFAQDVVYTITNGNVTPTKHITLPFTVKSHTGNVELVHTLSSAWPSLSYSQIGEIDTALICLQKLSLSDGQPALPRDMHSGIFTTLVWDIIDRQVEAVSGERTSPRVKIGLQSSPNPEHLGQ
jgi:hypothetical protein